MRSGRRLEIETVDINAGDQVADLRECLRSRACDVLFVNAGVTNDPQQTIADVRTEECIRVMGTNALTPMRVVEALHEPVTRDGANGPPFGWRAPIWADRIGIWASTKASRMSSAPCSG